MENRPETCLSGTVRRHSGKLAFFSSGLCNTRSMCSPRTTNRAGFVLLAPLLLAACGGESVEEAPAGPVVACALASSVEFTPDCTMERALQDGQSLLIVHHPDGGFRRFQLGVPGQGIIVADGADDALVTPGEGMIEVQVAEDRYRLPVSQ